MTMAPTLTIDKQQSGQFANLSGDWNPMHLDPVAARRVQFGDTVIHGVNGTLVALDRFFAQRQGQSEQIQSLSATYASPIVQGTPLEVVWQAKGENQFRLSLLANGKRAQLLKLTLTARDGSCKDHVSDHRLDAQLPAQLTLHNAIGRDEEVDICWDRELAETLFPSLCASVPHEQIANLLVLTRIVGMRCPGQHSVFAGFDVQFGPAEVAVSRGQARYQADSVDERFNRALLNVTSGCMQGEIETLFRPRPVQQASMEEISTVIPVGRFSAQRALVIGGSRGLGEVTAKMIAAGGGKVIITYASGQEDAQRVCTEIVAWGGQCEAIRLDIGNLDEPTLDAVFRQNITHLYHFSSPKITKNEQSFDNRLLQLFLQHYVFGLNEVLAVAADKHGYKDKALHLFIPSSIFIQEQKKGFAEYITAKAAAETCLAQIAGRYRQWTMSAPRLQPMLTDQTAGVTHSTPMDTVNSMLAHLPSDRG
ncbi:hypothetical protein GCM10027098_37760 [Bowmanella dokdonensis]